MDGFNVSGSLFVRRIFFLGLQCCRTSFFFKVRTKCAFRGDGNPGATPVGTASFASFTRLPARPRPTSIIHG